jgi:hypothetical protein
MDCKKYWREMFRRGGFRLPAANWDLCVLWPDSFRKRQSVMRYALVTSLPLCFPLQFVRSRASPPFTNAVD